MTSTSFENRELKLAGEFVQHTACNLFLTGKAGTGKTTFLHNLRGRTAKRMVITAPTGVAAINAGGVTLHSFFQLAFGPFVPGSEAYENKGRMFRFSGEKKRIIRSLDLLVIDEISMVRADVLDAVDAVLRRLRGRERPFGGVQLLMIGDLHQLSPVVKRDEQEILRRYYESAYFFSSRALAETELFTVELKHIYRQSDPQFIELLNMVRSNRLDAASIETLNRRYMADYTPDPSQGYITLTTHNKSADSINRTRLGALSGKAFSFTADVSGDFPEHIYPAPGTLVLRKGAQVMFLRNDPAAEKRYYNGKIGTVKKVRDGRIHILCPDDSHEIPVEPAEWENIKYTVNEETREIQEDSIGKFSQFPLKLAWAITIHKSQGLTFDKAIIDSQSVFAHGQVYVALSRCKTFEGMVLSSPIPSRCIDADEAVVAFNEAATRNPPSENFLQEAKISYQQQLLLECFDFRVLNNRFNRLMGILSGNAKAVQVYGVADMVGLRTTARKEIFMVAESFKRQLHSAFAGETPPESDPYILERTSKASQWFQEKFAIVFDDILEKLYFETDNREVGKRLKNALNNLKQEIVVRLAGVKSSGNGFSPVDYLRAVSTAELEFAGDKAEKRKKKPKAPIYGESDIEHPELFQLLKDWRARKAEAQGVERFQILNQQVLIQIAVNLPVSTGELRRIKGVGEKTMEKYGARLLEVVAAYREKHGVERVTPPERAVVESDTKEITLDMFRKGFTVSKIARERGLAENTIQGHLAFFVEKGDVDISELLSPEQREAIETALARNDNDSLKAVKDALGDDYSYGDIRLVMAHGNLKKSP